MAIRLRNPEATVTRQRGEIRHSLVRHFGNLGISDLGLGISVHRLRNYDGRICGLASQNYYPEVLVQSTIPPTTDPNVQRPATHILTNEVYKTPDENILGLYIRHFYLSPRNNVKSRHHTTFLTKEGFDLIEDEDRGIIPYFKVVKEKGKLVYEPEVADLIRRRSEEDVMIRTPEERGEALAWAETVVSHLSDANRIYGAPTYWP